MRRKRNKFLTNDEVFDMFFNTYPEYQRDRMYCHIHNEYPVDVRVYFSDFVDMLLCEGRINWKQANDYNLG